jgi:hypothetical protein
MSIANTTAAPQIVPPLGSFLQPGDEVAILPHPQASAAELIEISKVASVNDIFVQLLDGRRYATIGGKSLLCREVSYLVPASDEHRAALRKSATER